MAQLSTSVALDMTRSNALLDFGKGLLLSGGHPEFAFAPPYQVTLILPPNKNGLSDAISLNGEKLSLGTIKLPGGAKAFGPTGGTITGIDVWEFDHKKSGSDAYTYPPKMSLDDIKIDLGKTFAKLLKYDPIKHAKDLAKAAEGIYTDIFKYKDTFNGSSKDDTLKSYAGNDTIYGYGGKDTLFGGVGNDKIYGGDGRDTLYGQDGNDWLMGGKGGDTLEGGGKGSDWASYLDAAQGVTADLRNTIKSSKGEKEANKGGWAAGDKYGSIENLQGSRYDDKLIGDNKGNILLGDGGMDQLKGNAGADMFVFNDLYGDKVLDFHGRDMIGLDEDLFKGIGSAGAGDKGHKAIDEDIFRVNKTGFAEGVKDRIIFDSDDGKLYYDADGTGSSSSMLIAELYGSNGKHLTDLSPGKVFVTDLDFLTI